jgi:hypothetical protein
MEPTEKQQHMDLLLDQYAKRQAAFFQAVKFNDDMQREVDRFDPSDERHTSALVAAGVALRDVMAKDDDLQQAVTAIMNCVKAEGDKRGVKFEN